MNSRSLSLGSLLLGLLLLATLGCPEAPPELEPELFAAPPSPESVAGHTSGVIARDGVIRVRFTGDLADERDLGRPLSPSPFALEPSASGEASWANPRELVFRPNEPLEAGQRYRVALNPAVLSGLDGRLEPFGFEFDVLSQSFDLHTEGLRPSPSDPAAGQQLTGSIITADAAVPEDIERMLTLTHAGEAFQVEWSHDLARRRHAFVAGGIVRQEAESSIQLSIDGSPIGVDRAETRAVPVPGLNQFVVAGVTAITADTRHVEARFSDPLEPGQDLAGLVRSSDDSTLRFKIEGNVLRVYRSGTWPSQATIVFEPGIRNAAGHRLLERATYTVGFSPLAPEVKFTTRGVLLPTTGELTLPIETANLSAIDVQATRVHTNNLTQFLQVNTLDGSREMRRVGEIVWRRTVDLRPPPGSETRFVTHGLDIAPLLAGSGGGLYQIRLSFRPEHSLFECPPGTFREDFVTSRVPAEVWEEEQEQEQSNWNYYENHHADSIWNTGSQPWEMWRHRKNPCHQGYYRKHQDHDIAVTRNVLVTDLGLVAKRGTDGSLFVVATDLGDARPRAGAEIRALDFQRQELATGRTDDNGAVVLQPSKAPYFVLASHQGSDAILRLEEGAALAVGHLDVGGLQVSQGLKGLIYGERGVWRPGDDIFLTFVLHDPTGRIPARHPINFELVNSRGQVVHQSTQASSVDGFYALRTRTEENAATGNYTARVRVGGATFEEVVKIETIMPNRLKIDLDLPDEPIRGPKPRLTTMLRSAWLHGAPARSLRADVEMTLRTVPTRFDRYEGYTFDDPTRQFRPETKMVYQGSLDESGIARVDEAFDAGRPPGMLAAHLTTRVFEPSGAFSTDSFTVPVSPYPRYLGIRTPPGDRARGMLLTDEKHPLRIVAVDTEGNPVDGVEVDVALYKIQWRWWWESGPEDLPDYAASASHTPIQQGKVTLNNGEGVFEFEVNYPSWGRYLLLVRDEQGGHRAGRIVYIDWPGWAGRAMEDRPGAASVLAVSSDRARYETGETAVLTIPTPHRGRALVTLENGSRVLSASWVEASGEMTRQEIPITSDMAPGVYANVTLLQPHAGRGNDLPLRLYGVVPLEVEEPRTRLSPVIATADVFEPQSTVQVNVSEAVGRPMAYTLAVVDEGLLGLTRFQTPDPWSRFYRREALGVTTWDVYDDVAGAHGGAFDRLVAIGGDSDGDADNDADQKADRFPPVVRFLGPFALAAGETASHSIDIPQYVGAVRVMVVAGQDGAFGRAQKTVLVKKPLMLLATLPRVLGPGEEVELPVSVFALEDDIRNVAIRVETTSGLRIDGEPAQTLTFSGLGDQMASFRLKVSTFLGVERVRVIATSGTERAEQEIEIDVRHPGQPEMRILAGTVEPGATWSPQLELTGLAGTNQVFLEVSRVAPMNLTAHLDYLVGYPHGCLEQVMSRVFPQLHLSSLMELDANRQGEIAGNIQAGIARVVTHQTSSGGFGYWSSDQHHHDWTSSYVGHFLLEAKQGGHPVPTGVLHRWESHQRRVAQAFVPGSVERSDLIQAYRLYTLALAGKPEMGAMNRLREQKELSAPARWRLAAAYQLAAQPEAARRLVENAHVEVAKYQELGNTFGSALRDQAMMLETAVLIGDSQRVNVLSREIAETLSSGRGFNTQELGFALIAMARTMSRFGEAGEMRFGYAWNESRASVRDEKPIHSLELPADSLSGAPTLTVTNNGSSALFTRLMISGLPEVGGETPTESGLRVTVTYRDRNGNTVPVDRLEQGTDIVARVTVTNTRRQRLSELALTHIVPSGWEIRNERMTSGGGTGSSATFDHRDIRDDRVHTYFGLGPSESKSYDVRLHSAYPGRFYLPGISVEAMYDATIHGRVAGGWVEVARPGLTG